MQKFEAMNKSYSEWYMRSFQTLKQNQLAKYLEDETWAHVKVTNQDQRITSQLNSLEMIITDDLSANKSETSDFLVSQRIYDTEKVSEEDNCLVTT